MDFISNMDLCAPVSLFPQSKCFQTPTSTMKKKRQVEKRKKVLNVCNYKV